MGFVYYPGNVSDGEAATNTSVNSRTKQNFQALNPKMEGGLGIGNENIADGGLSDSVIGGGLITVEGAAAQEVLKDTRIQGTFRFYTKKMEEAATPDLAPTDGDSVSYFFDGGVAPTSVTDFRNPPAGHMIFTFYGAEEDTTPIVSNNNFSMQGPIFLRNHLASTGGEGGSEQPPFPYSGMFVRWPDGGALGNSDVWFEVGANS